LAIVMSHSVNGVAAIHTDILKNSLFKEFVVMYPKKFLNITNGITPRRWLASCNPTLTDLITETLGDDEFLTELTRLHKLREHASDVAFQNKWMTVKQANKVRFANWLNTHHNITVDPTALFDIQVKRLHEYKRQFLNILRVVYEYNELRRKVETGMSLSGIQAKVIIFAGKAAPGYFRAKKIIKFINSVAERVNSDKSIKNLIKVFFIPNYNVSLAEIIVPASDISEHISTAGMEASGTSNMKFALNGGLIVGTLDGANIEIRDAIGHENMFIFGLTEDQVEPAREKNKTIEKVQDPRLIDVIQTIRSGHFGDASIFEELIESLKPSYDYYLLGDDFGSYVECHQKLSEVFKDQHRWAKMSIMSTAGMGMFSSDRSIQEYAEKIWGIKAVNITEELNRDVRTD